MTLLRNFRKKYIGSRGFYRMLFIILVPLVVRQGITNFVSLLDNVMVGQLDPCEMNAVAISNQLIFVFNLAIFGGLSGAAIFSAQFFGSGDWKSMRDTFRFKLYFAVIGTAIAVLVFTVWREPLVMMFLKSDKNTPEDIASILFYSGEYMKYALIGLLPFALVQAYSGSLNEMGETRLPMFSGMIAIGLNLVLNYLLIYGKFGFPALGVKGAAIATVISRFAELALVVVFTHAKNGIFLFVKGVYRSARVPFSLIKRIVITGAPLMFNEVLWSLAQTMINKSYSLRGDKVLLAVMNTATAWNLFCVIMFGFGTAVSIIIGQKLGAGDREGAMDAANKLLFATFASQCVVSIIIFATAGLIPELYNVDDYVKKLEHDFLIVCGIMLPLHSIVHDVYFTIRSGGKTYITFLFDSFYEWVISFTTAYFLCARTELDIVLVYFFVMLTGAVKLVIGVPMLRSGFWANTLVDEKQ